jgi:hypothetical protein
MTTPSGQVWRSLLSLFLVGVIVFVASPFMSDVVQNTAQAATSGRSVPYLQNGSFENYTSGVPDNWTVTNGRIDLGVDSLGGCVTQDTVDYAGIFTRSTLYGSVPIWPFPFGSGDKPTADNDAFTGTFSSNSVTSVVGASTLAPTEGTYAYLMTIASGRGSSGHIVHGPAVVSDVFRATAGQVITMNWYSAAGGDDFAVLGYLLDTSTCTQTTIFETTGTSISTWQYAAVTIPANADTYRFVFVSGTFDKSGGTVSGSKFWLDNISQGTPQTVTFELGTITANFSPGNTTAPFQLPGTSSSGMAISYTSNTPAKCTVTTGGMLTVVAAGTCTITATQTGGETGGTLYASSPSVTKSFEITAISATAQTITFAAPTDRLATDADFDLTATATSGLAVTFTSSTPSVCTVSGVSVNLLAAGTCTIVAAQAGGVNSGTTYAVAPTVTRSFLSQGSQTITFGALSDKDPTAADFAVSATSSAGLTVTYSTTSTGVCSVTSAGMVSILGAGTCTISANQAGGTTGGITYVAAPAVSQTFTVRTGQIITFVAPADRAEDAANFPLTATSSVGLTVSYVSNSTSVCTVTSAGVVSIVGFGTCSITASAPAGTVGGVSYAAAPSVTRTFVIKKKQTITFAAPADRLYNVADFNLTVSASSTLPVTLTSSTPSVCTVSGVSVNLIAPGTCTISATQAGGLSGGTDFAAAPTVTQSFSSNAVPQTISMPTIPESHEYQGGVDLAGTTTSGLEITYTSTTPTVCTVTGKRVTFVGIGKCSIKGSQAGGTRGGIIYAPSSDLTREFFVTNYTPTATMTPTSTRTFTPTMTPTPIPFLMKKGAVGASFVLGLLQNGTLITWGMNREFQANIPPCCGSAIDDVAVGTNFALALKGGRVFGWGANTKGQLRFPASTARNITAIAAGGAHGLALNKTGKVVSWGDNGFKQALVPKALKDVTQIAGGANHSLVITKAGRVVAWGSNASNQSKPPTTLSNVIQVAGGLDHSLALRRDGTVVAWGGNAFGQGAVPATAINVKQVSAGNQFSLVVQNDGTVFGWGRNDNNVYVIPPEYTDIYTVAAGYANTILGLRNGRVIVIGDQTNGIDVSRTPTGTATPTP